MEEKFRAIAAQLRKPHGEYASQVGETMNKGNLHINLNAIKTLNVAPGDSILEIGMGNGYFVRKILSQDSTVSYVGCDFSQSMVEESVRRNVDFVNEGRAKFFLASAESLPVTNESATKVLTVNTIYFWDDRKSVFKELRRVLKPGGMLVIAIRPKSSMQHYPFVRFGFNMFSSEELAAEVAANGFQVSDIQQEAESDQEMEGITFQVHSLIISAIKRSDN